MGCFVTGFTVGQPQEKLDPQPSANVPQDPAGTPVGRLEQLFGAQQPFGPPAGG